MTPKLITIHFKIIADDPGQQLLWDSYITDKVIEIVYKEEKITGRVTAYIEGRTRDRRIVEIEQIIPKYYVEDDITGEKIEISPVIL